MNTRLTVPTLSTSAREYLELVDTKCDEDTTQYCTRSVTDCLGIYCVDCALYSPNKPYNNISHIVQVWITRDKARW